MAVASNPLESFVWGAGGQKMSPEEVARQREIAAALMKGGMDYSPVEHWMQGAARAAQGLVGGLKDRWANEAAQSGREGFQSQISNLFGGGSSATSPVASALVGGSPVSSANSGTGDAFLDALVNSESGGNWQALNNEGYGGRLQFGEARLADAARAGVISAGMTGGDFSMMSPEVQQAVEAWHFNDIDQQAANMGLDKYYGQTIAGVPINQNSIRSMAHLGGIGGAQKFVTSGGQYNPADSNGTRLSDYGSRFGGMSAGGARSQPAPMQVAQVGGGGSSTPSVAELLSLSGNEWATPAQSSVLNALIGQQLEQQDPRYQQQLAMGDLQMQQLQQQLNATPYRPSVLTPEQMAQYGLPEGSGSWILPESGIPQNLYAPPAPAEIPDSVQSLDLRAQRAGLLPGTPEYNDFMVTGGSRGQTINVGGNNDIGTIPSGMMVTRDAAGNVTGMQPIPGSPAEQEAIAAQEAAAAGAAQTGRYGNVVVEDIDRALDVLNKDPTWSTGILGQAMGNIRGSSSDRLNNLLDTVRANSAFDRLQAMRDASPTGGALGAVSERELGLLQSAIGSLETGNPEDLAYNLKRLQSIYSEIIDGPKSGQNQSQAPRFSSKAEYDAAPSGTLFTDPEGKLRVKP